MIWLHKSAVIKALSDLIDQESDDAAAMSQQDLEVRLAEIGRDRLRVEREEACLIWAVQAAGDSIEHRGRRNTERGTWCRIADRCTIKALTPDCLDGL